MQAILAETLHLPPVAHMEDRVLTIDATASDADLINVTLRILAVAEHSQWALSSALHELHKRKGETWLNEFCASHRINPKLRRELIAVHTFYPPEKRQLGLTYGHYRDAMLAVNDGKPRALERASAHLQRAFDHSWSVSELRKAARAHEAPTARPDAPEQPGLLAYQAVLDMARYAHAELPSMSRYTPARARLVLQDLGETIEFISRLQAIASL